MERLIVWAVVLLIAGPAEGEELYLFGGGMLDRETGEQSYSWQIEYRDRLTDRAAWSLVYLNEGHISRHHRDGHGLQLWLESGGAEGFSLGAGIGPFYFFDTLAAPAGVSHYNDHGWGGIASLALLWQGRERQRYSLRANIVETSDSIDTLSVLLGFGYSLAETGRPAPENELPRQRDRKNELTAFFGRTIVNSFGSEPADAVSIEYRRAWAGPLEWTLSWLHEGANHVIDRNGLLAQVWAARHFFRDRLTLGAGFGPYHGIDRHRDEGTRSAHDRYLIGIATLSAGYRFSPDLGVRISWHRTVTDYDRDTDVILAGIGTLF